MNKTQKINNFRKILNKHITDNPEEANVGNKFLKLLEKDKEKAFYRDNLPGHFIGNTLVINPDYSKVLLMHHKKLNFWVDFGGHADGEIDLKDVAMRELEEESGIKIDENKLLDKIGLAYHSIPEHKSEPEHYHFVVRYVVVLPEDVKFKKQEIEVNDIKWFDVSDLKNIDTSEEIVKLVENLRNNK